jgi:replicative DNA helicase
MIDETVEKLFTVSKDVAAERAVLAGLYTYGQDAYLDIAPMITVLSFTDKANQAIYKCFEYLFEEKELKQIDESSFFSAAKDLGYNWLFELKDEIAHVKAIFNTHIILENVRQFSGRISRLEIARMLKQQMLDGCIQLSALQGEEPLEQILGIGERCIFDFTSKLTAASATEPQLLGNGMRDYIVSRMDNPVEMVGIPSPWPRYNAAIGGGWRRKAVSMLGARSGIGKSILADNAAEHLATLDFPVLYIDTEMCNEDHWCRVGANVADVEIDELETGKAGKDKNKRKRVLEMLDKIEGIPFHYLNVSGVSFEETAAIIRRWVHKTVGFAEDGRTKNCIIIYDYLKLMSGEDLKVGVQEYQVLGFMMTTLHNLGVRNDVPLVVLTQLNRDGLDKEDASVVAGSDRVIWLTTNFTVFKPKSDEEIAAGGLEDGTHKFVIIKQRHGPGMVRGDYINVFMEGAKARISEGKTKYELKRIRERVLVDQPAEIATEVEDIPIENGESIF